MTISDSHLAHWHEHGYVVVEDFFTREELIAARAGIDAIFPTRQMYATFPDHYRSDVRGGHMIGLPYLGDELNLVAVHPDIVSFVEVALGTMSIMLVQSLVWAKYPIVDDFHQPLHCDYMHRSLLYPAVGPAEDVTFILYYQDVDESLGPTYVVSRKEVRDKLLVPYVRSEDHDPDLYALERAVRVRAGSLLIYDMATFHRGSAIRSRDAVRYSHHIAYRVCDGRRGGDQAWANCGPTPEMQRFIERASPRQRELVGFPPAGDPYWNEETLSGIAARYPAMDMSPYIRGMSLGPSAEQHVEETVRARQFERHEPAATTTRAIRTGIHASEFAHVIANRYRVARYYAWLTGLPLSYWLPWIAQSSKDLVR